MRRTIISILIGTSIGLILGASHVVSARSQESWAISNRPTPEVFQVEVNHEESEQGADHFLHDMGYKIDPDIPLEIQQCAESIGYIYGICPELLESMAYQESRFNPKAVSGDGSCIGLMQVNPRWHRDRMERLSVSKEDLKTVRGNMLVAADYLKELFDTYEDPGIVLMTYNGDSRAQSFAQSGRLSYYAKEILDRSSEWETKHEKRP